MEDSRDISDPRPREACVEEAVHKVTPQPNELAEAAHGSPVDPVKVEKVRIVRATDGGQLRTVITGNKLVRTIAYPSMRYRCVRYGEATTECVRLPAEEICPVTVHSVAQPMRIEARIEGRWHRSVVDCAALRSNGDRLLVECKDAWSSFRTRRGATQAFLAKIGALTLGYGYERYVLANAGSERRRANVEEVQACRFVRVPDVLVARAAALLDKEPVPLVRLAGILDQEPAVGRARAFALAAMRVVEIDLEGALDASTECRATPAPSDFMPSLLARPA